MLLLLLLSCIPDAKMLDEDQDQYAAAAQGGDDCDDGDPLVHPGAEERCDGADEDCDGVADDNATDASTWYADADGDAFGDDADPVVACAPPEGYTDEAGDCDDTDPAAHPGAPETCDDLDDDCDGTADEDPTDAPSWYADADRDGYGDPADAETSCDPPAGRVTDDGDCDDGDAEVHPAAVERCDDRDEDCDGSVDEDPSDARTWYEDADGDGHGDPGAATGACDAPSGWSADGDDCNDGDPSASPDALEQCNGIDDDCDGTVDGASSIDALTWHFDADGDGHGDPSRPVSDCTAPAGTVSNADDCDDSEATVSPASAELCNARDDDCDGTADDAAIDAGTWYEDLDGDGYGVTPVIGCEPPPDTAILDGDCDDTDAGVSPAAAESCNGGDDDCDGTTDEDGADGAIPRYRDTDGDGFGSDDALSTCEPVSGRVDVTGDCDDADPAILPDAIERCDEVDEDCDGTVDDDAIDTQLFYEDLDGDGFGTTAVGACEAPPSHVLTGGDCDDDDGSAYPDAPEVCDGADQDCDTSTDEGFDADADGLADCFDVEQCDELDNDGDGTIDEEDAADAPTWYADLDGDGFGDPATAAPACVAPPATSADATDCDDSDPARSPATPEACDGDDNDCDGLADEADAVDAPSWYTDGDGDGYGDNASADVQCNAPVGTIAEGGDCADTDAAIHPGAVETCDGVDDNCSGDEGDAAEATRMVLRRGRG